jgi:GT2 family glycosyltransferase
MKTPLVYVIILNYNGQKYLEACLSSINAQTYENYKVILCDNNSSDSSVDYVRNTFPSIFVLEAKENLGFAEGNNLAIRFALAHAADFIFLLNNDTTVEANLLEKLVTTAQSDVSVGIVGPAIFDYTNKDLLHEAGMTTDVFGYPLALKNIGDQNSVGVVFVSGAALLVKASVLKQIGLFDKDYFMFAEDLDLCWRTLIAGYNIVVDSKAKIFHVSGGSISGGVAKSRKYSTDTRRILLREKNTITTLIKNYDLSNLFKIVPMYISLISFEAIFWFCLQKPQTGLSIFKAVYQNIKSFPNSYKMRLQVQSLRKEPDLTIKRKMSRGYGKLMIFRKIGIPHFK